MRAPGVTGTQGMGDINILEGDIGNADAFVHFSVLSQKLPWTEDTLQGEATWPPRSQRLWRQVTDLGEVLAGG